MWLGSDPNIITTSTNQNLLQPTKTNKRRRASNIQKDLSKGKHRVSNGDSDNPVSRRSRAPALSGLLQDGSSSSLKSTKSGRSQLVDLVIEDTEAEEIERVRARKEGGALWNEDEAKLFIRAYGDDQEGKVHRGGFQPSEAPTPGPSKFAVSNDENEHGDDRTSEGGQQWNERREGGQESSVGQTSAHYDNLDDRHVWNSKDEDDTKQYP